MADDVLRLLDDFAARYARGERPDARDYLAHAGEDADELAALLERFLALRSPPRPATETVELMRSWRAGEPPLLELRRRRGLRRSAVVDGLVRILGLRPEQRAKVAGYYHELESGLLDAGRVDRRVFAALAETLGARLEDILPWSPPLRAGGVYHRLAEPASTPPPAAKPASPPPPAERGEEGWDEVDRLFRGGR